VNKLTLDDIAKQAGVSRSTVSRVINNHPNVKKEVRERILSVIETNKFHPNAAARTLAMQRSWTIGVILPHSVSVFFTDPYFPHLLKGISRACNQNGFSLALFLVSTKEDEENVFSRIGRKGFLDGVIVQSGHHGDQGIIERIHDSDMPMVVVGRPLLVKDVTYIDIDNIKASYLAVNHLIHSGCKRIGTITGPFVSSVGIDRLQGYRQAMIENNLPTDESLIIEGSFTETSGYEAMKALLPHKPDGVFAASDVMAIGAMSAIEEIHLKIPEDISIVGFDDLPIPGHGGVQLTTIRQNVPEFGMKAVETLIDLIENGKKPPQQIIMETELILRNSCKLVQ
jgi:LacI family transcriptional regulator